MSDSDDEYYEDGLHSAPGPKPPRFVPFSSGQGHALSGSPLSEQEKRAKLLEAREKQQKDQREREVAYVAEQTRKRKQKEWEMLHKDEIREQELRDQEEKMRIRVQEGLDRLNEKRERERKEQEEKYKADMLAQREAFLNRIQSQATSQAQDMGKVAAGSPASPSEPQETEEEARERKVREAKEAFLKKLETQTQTADHEAAAAESSGVSEPAQHGAG